MDGRAGRGARRRYSFPGSCRLAKWLSGAKLYIGNDSGITHLAAAIGIPTLALFGPTDPGEVGAPGTERYDLAILNRSGISQSMTVLAAANRLLRSPSEVSSI